jgi:serpin B
MCVRRPICPSCALAALRPLGALLLSLAAMLSLCGCGSPPAAVRAAQVGKLRVGELRTGELRASMSSRLAPPTQAQGAALTAGDARFAGRLLRLLARGGGNVVVSPFSLTEALAMLYAGARGSTRAQIARALDFRLAPAPLASALHAAGRELASASTPGETLRIAAALFAQRGLPVRRSFLAALARYYAAGVWLLDFQRSPQAAAAAINRWASRRTDGLIPNLLGAQDLDPQTRLVLTDAVYLHARWLEPFRPAATAPAPFQSPGGSVRVAMMHESAQLAYRRGAGYRALELPYRGGRLALDVLLPARGRAGSLLARLATRGPGPLLAGMRRRLVALSLPRISLRYRADLAPALAALGMPLAFDPLGADLSGIAGRPHQLYLKAVAHEAYLRLDEAGTTAAAASAAVVNLSSLAVSSPQALPFDVDRPFVLVLRDLDTGAILFAAAVNRPA